MVIRVLDYVKQCYTADDGRVIAAVLRKALADSATVELSFAGVNNAPSGFVNAALVSLLSSYSHSYIRNNLRITDVTPQVADVIRRRFNSETSHAVAA